MNHISVTILTRNEASLIGDCLESLQGIAEEKIVVDTYSDDDTVKICRDYGCKVIQRQFNGYG
ncbi:MAG: glycosyltransferase, partial [Muribaculaceae bacterium]|nr:glycosyltransferase [Muribaculaceae bacterium]